MNQEIFYDPSISKLDSLCDSETKLINTMSSKMEFDINNEWCHFMRLMKIRKYILFLCPSFYFCVDDTFLFLNSIEIDFCIDVVCCRANTSTSTNALVCRDILLHINQHHWNSAIVMTTWDDDNHVECDRLRELER